MDDLIQQCVEKLVTAQKLVVSTGAGVSQESGIPTFRDQDTGLWEEADPLLYASPIGWALQPREVWNWYHARRQEMQQAKPNPGHHALVALEQLVPQVVVITQNIDRLHHQAGSRDIVALHGDMYAYKCDQNCQGDPTPVNPDAVTWTEETAPPRCPYCETGKVRPDVVWFGEMLQRAHVERALNEARTCDVILVAGTAGKIPLSVALPAQARERGAFVIEVNPNESDVTPHAHVRLAGPSGIVLPKLVAALRAAR
ncbi:MAG: NAD-dependent protein deacylase [Anaerolineae bacterium]|nr:NAD-dependent protein deacylase [Anaerolineae bacterium]